MKKFLVLLLLAVVPVQELAAWNSQRLIKMMRTENGLSNDYIVSVDIDRDGTVWIGTEEGMDSFDGVRIRSYTKSTGTLSGNALNDVLPDRNADRVWVATQRFGASVYDYSDGHAEFFIPEPSDSSSLISREITHIEQDSEGNIWFSTYRRGLEKYDVASGKFVHYNSDTVEGMEDWSIIGFVLGNDGRVYMGHYSDGFTVLDPESMTAVHFTHDPDDPSSLPSDVVGCVYRDFDNNVWVGTGRGLALYRPVTDDFKVYDESNSGIPSRIIFSIMVTRDRHIYVSPNFMGVWTADLADLSRQPRFTPFAEAAEISSLPVRDMCEDEFGNLWIGSYGRGVLFVGSKIPGFSMVSAPEVLSAKNVTAVTTLDDGNIVVGTQGGGIDVLDPGLSRLGRRPADRMLTDRTIMGLFQDSAGDIWTGSFSGRTVVTDSTFTRAETIDIWEARCFLERNDTIWVGSGSGLWTVDRVTRRILDRYSVRNILPENYLRCLCEDADGNLWVGSFGSGILIYDSGMNEVARFNTANGLPSDLISALLCVGDRVYAATGEGLVCFSGRGGIYGITDVLTMEDGISSDGIKAMVPDSDGKLWFSTNLSVCLLDPADGSVTEFRNYSDRAFPTGNFNGNSCATGLDGNIFFGSTEGLVGFVPGELETPIAAPGVSFKEIVIYGDDISAHENETFYIADTDSYGISWKRSDFGLTFSVDDYSLSEVVNYYGKIDGSVWFPVVGGNRINFRDLSSGRHTVMVKARIRDGEFGPVSTFGIHVQWPFWWSPVSWIVYVLMLSALISAALIRYKRKSEKESNLRREQAALALAREANEERLRFYTNITHELRTPLTLIIGPVDDLMNDKELPESARARMATLSKNVHRLLELVNRLLDFRKVETSNYEISLQSGDLSATVETAGKVFFETKTNPSVKFRMNIAKGVFGVFDPEIVTVILNNLLSNAFKFTPSGVICLNLYPVTVNGEQSAEIIVSDTGYGIAKEQIPKIFERYYQVKDGRCVQGTGIGLSLVKSLVSLHGGTIEVESEVGRGSNFRVVLPLESVETAAARPAETQRGGVDISDDRRLVAVVAEDNEDICAYIAETLEEDGFSVYRTHNGSEAYSRIVECNPDLIISDIMMPVLDGLTLCRMVKQDMRFSHIPLILLTAKDSIDDRSEGYKAGADSYLIKPFTGELLRSRIHNMMESRNLLVSRVSSSIGKGAAAAEETGFSDIDNEFLKKVTLLVEENIASESLDVSFLAEKMNMSNSTLYRKLKSLSGLSANEFIRKIRMHKAEELLSKGGCNVSEAAWSVGISSIIYFRQCFKHEFGVLPSEYRRSRHGKPSGNGR